MKRDCIPQYQSGKVGDTWGLSELGIFPVLYSWSPVGGVDCMIMRYVFDICRETRIQRHHGRLFKDRVYNYAILGNPISAPPAQAM